MGESCWALSSSESSPAIKMQQIVLLTHLYLVTSIPSNYIELPPMQCCLPSAGLWESYWWEQNPSTCSAQVLSRVYVEMVISAQLCSLLSLSHLGSQLVLLNCVPWLNGPRKAKMKLMYPCVLALVLWRVTLYHLHWDSRGFTEMPERNAFPLHLQLVLYTR